MNHVARTRYATIIARTVGGGSSGGGSRSAGVARGVDGEPVAAMSSMVAPTVVINTAVIGNRYDVMRAVSDATRTSVRLAGRRQLVGAGL